MRKIILSCLLTISYISVSSQEYYQLEEMFLDADSWFFYEDYKEALPLFQRVLDVDSTNYNVMYKIGFCYLHIPGQKIKSIPYLEKAADNYTLNYRNNTYAERKAPLDAVFYLGNAYLINNQIDEAIDAYTAFQNKISQNKKILNKDIYDKEYIQKQFDACRNALTFQENPVNFIASNLGSPINTRFTEFNPVVSGDGSTLAFTSSLKFYDAIFYSKKENGKWTFPINLMAQLGVDDNTSTLSLSQDGKELYLYRDDDFDGNIYVSFFRNGKWTKIKKLNENINTKYWESHASLSPDGKKLYFASNRDGGFGDLDIYVSERLTDTTWGVPENLGDNINTQWNENTPFLSVDGSKLFFSSEGHENMGGYDIFYSENINGEWSKPVNIGYPINTTDHDLFFVPYENGKFAYSSEYSYLGHGGADIYFYQLFHIPQNNQIKVEGILTMDNPDNRNRKDFIIHITDTVNNDTIAILHPDKDKEKYQYRTSRGKDHLVWEGKSDKGALYFISKEYKIKEVFLEPVKLKEPKKIALEDSVPEIKLEQNNFQVISDQENVKIKLSLQKGNKLIVNTFYKDKLINSEEFNIHKEEFIYEYKPLEGQTRINFSLIDKNKNIKTEEVTISYIPADTKAELAITGQMIDFSDGNKKVKIKLSVEKNSKLFVETYVENKLINKESFDVKKDEFTYEFEPKAENSRLLFKLVDKHQNITKEEIIISHKPVSKEFADVLNNIIAFDSKTFKQIITSKNITQAKTVKQLINNFYTQANNAGLSEQDAKTLIVALAINATNNTNKFISDLAKIATGDLKFVLDSAIQHNLPFNSNLDVVNYLKKQTANYDYSYNDIVNLLETYLQVSDFEVEYLVQILTELTNYDFNNILANMDVSALDIITLDDFKNYLNQQNIYSKKQLEQIYAIFEGLLLNQAKETEPADDKEIASKIEDDNQWVLLTSLIICFIILGLIIVFFNQRKSNRNRKDKIQ
ncbi:MAG TPA: hypothetical protein VK982_06840 [Bacteroidales bacterium]|nr:hypothetical protein [Bacteroidales bacterium]